MGKRKVKNEEALKRVVLPEANDVLGIATRVLGAERFLVKCQDGKERLCRIRGKMKKRAWIREGAGGDGNLLADVDVGFVPVQHQDRWRFHHLYLGHGFQGGDHEGHFPVVAQTEHFQCAQ